MSRLPPRFEASARGDENLACDGMTPWVTRIVFANVAIYILIPFGSRLFGDLVLVPALVLTRPWTPVTYMFLHGSFMHLLFNMLILFFLGPRLESRLQGRNFLGLYLLSGIFGAALSFVFTYPKSTRQNTTHG